MTTNDKCCHRQVVGQLDSSAQPTDPHGGGDERDDDDPPSRTTASPMGREIFEHEGVFHFSMGITFCAAIQNSVSQNLPRNRKRRYARPQSGMGWMPFRLIVNDVNVLRRSSFWKARPGNRPHQSAKGMALTSHHVLSL